MVEGARRLLLDEAQRRVIPVEKIEEPKGGRDPEGVFEERDQAERDQTGDEGADEGPQRSKA